MFHPVNGRKGFDLLSPCPKLVSKKPSLDIMVQMLKREDELRLSPAIQEKFSNPDFDTIHVAEEVQKQVVSEFGFENMEETLSMIRSAPLLYPECPEVRKIPHYINFNRSKQGDLSVGDTIPNSKLAYVDGTPIDLYKYIDSYFYNNKPIIINAGSYTWLPFCAYVQDMHNMFKKYSREVNFLTIYIVEAHAVDEWPVGDPLKVSQPLSTVERCGVARSFVKEYNYQIPVLVDLIDNNFSETWAAWPIRFYVVEDKRNLVYKAQPDEKNTYDSIPIDLERFIESRYS